MPPSHLAPAAKPLSGRYLSFAEREEIAIWRAQRHGVREIARRLERAPSTISRELRRNAATRSGGLAYRATTAQWHADRSARRPKSAKLAINEPLRRYVQDRLAGVIIAPNGAAVRGPVVPWKGRRHGRRQDRRWATAWSPEQIARRLRLDFPDDETMRISHEAIYQALYVQGRGSAAPRADRLPAHRAGVAGAAGAQPRTGQVLHRPRDPDQPAPGGGGRSGGAGPLGGGPHPGAGQLGHRHPGGAHDAVHDPAPPAAAWRATVTDRAPRTGPRSPGMGLRRCATPSRARSPPYPSNCDDR